MNFLNLRDHQQAFILPSLLISSMMITLMGITILQLVVTNFRIAAADVHRLNAQIAADAGLDNAIVELNTDNTYTGTSEEEVLYTAPGGDFETRYEIDVTDGADGTKIVNSIGSTYVPASAGSPIVEREYEIEIEGLSPAVGNFSLVTGVGGLIMRNSSKIVAGEVFVNGTITMENSSQIGLSTSPVVVKSAHQSCPLGGGASYPIVCASGDPISITNPAWIYADVCATNQTDSSRMSGDGLITPITMAQCGEDTSITPLSLPVHDRATQKSNASGTADIASFSCNSSSSTPTVWPANYRVGGDVTLKKKCNVIIEGDVWIEGDVDLDNTARFTISDTADLGVDGNRPTIMVDGTAGVTLSNSSNIVASSSDVGAQVITYYSTAGCSPDCADVTGNDLFNSSSITTIQLEQLAKAPESLIYARWTQAAMDNGGDIGAIVGQTVLLSNSATITFGAGTGGGGGSTENTFVVRSYKRVF